MPPWSLTGSELPTALTGRIRQPTRLVPGVDLTRLQALHSERYPYLLQSISRGTAQARYDILCAFPQETVSLASLAEGAPDFLGILDRFTREPDVPADATADLPFVGGWFVYLGYEMAAQIEPVLRPALRHAPPLPVAFASHTPAALVHDHQQQCTYVVTQPGWEHLTAKILHDIEASLRLRVADIEPQPARVLEEPDDHYCDAVTRIQRYIREGDVFQVNLSRAWWLEFAADLPAQTLYRRLCRHNPAPFAACVYHNDVVLMSSSPERLFKLEKDILQTRPIAGTRPRYAQHDEDLASSRDLLSHPKERAEHIMLIDLERNDLGRICVPGSVRVSELMTLESYAHVHHIVSNVQGRVPPATSPGEIIRALFPGGTITGCPKVRCMQIIAELEAAPRGAYTGAVGYISANGNMDFNILIRTLTLRGRQAHFRTGAGIVADSDPQRELQETRAKARGLLLALGVTR